MVKVNKIESQTVELFDNKNNSLGFINEEELSDIRIQILNESQEGYYIIFDNNKLSILNNGKLYQKPYNLFNVERKCMDQLIMQSKHSKAWVK